MTGSGVIPSLVLKWRVEADVLRKNGDKRGAFLKELGAMELEGALAQLQDQLLTRDEAARLLGVHPDSVSRMERQGRLTNVGRRHAPRFRQGDVLDARGISAEIAQARQASPTEPRLADYPRGTSRSQIARAIADS
jgi:hypothetical protein